jgi:hypothetical protein
MRSHVTQISRFSPLFQEVVFFLRHATSCFDTATPSRLFAAQQVACRTRSERSVGMLSASSSQLTRERAGLLGASAHFTAPTHHAALPLLPGHTGRRMRIAQRRQHASHSLKVSSEVLPTGALPLCAHGWFFVLLAAHYLKAALRRVAPGLKSSGQCIQTGLIQRGAPIKVRTRVRNQFRGFTNALRSVYSEHV